MLLQYGGLHLNEHAKGTANNEGEHCSKNGEMGYTKPNLPTPHDNPDEEADDDGENYRAKNRTGNEIATEESPYVQRDRDSREQADVEASLRKYLSLTKEPEAARQNTQRDPAERASMDMCEQDILAEGCDMQTIEDADADRDGKDGHG